MSFKGQGASGTTRASRLALACALLLSRDVDAQTKPPRRGTKEHKLLLDLTEKVQPSPELKNGWVVETPTHIVHSTISKEYLVMAAVHLNRFHHRFVSIFKEPFIDTKKPVAYAFATEKEYLAFSPGSKGTQGRHVVWHETTGVKKNLAWFSTPQGEKDFYATDYGVVQHEATHQLLDAYTDNQDIPVWFHEGCATFFEKWNLDETNAKNILSGVSEDYALRICLTYPHQKPPPPLETDWIAPRNLLQSKTFEEMDALRKREDDPAEAFKIQMRVHQQYSEAWCAMTFFIDNDVGRKVFTLFVTAFREKKDLDHIQQKYYTEEFLRSFEKEWYRFIEKKVLGKWELSTVGGKKLRVGDGRAPPAKTEGFALTDDRRGDLFLLHAKKGDVPKAFEGQIWWMLEAWGVPVAFYKEAWKKIPQLLTKGEMPIVGSSYGLFSLPSQNETKVFILLPIWAPLGGDSQLGKNLAKAGPELVAKASEK